MWYTSFIYVTLTHLYYSPLVHSVALYVQQARLIMFCLLIERLAKQLKILLDSLWLVYNYNDNNTWRIPQLALWKPHRR